MYVRIQVGDDDNAIEVYRRHPTCTPHGDVLMLHSVEDLLDSAMGEVRRAMHDRNAMEARGEESRAMHESRRARRE